MLDFLETFIWILTRARKLKKWYILMALKTQFFPTKSYISELTYRFWWIQWTQWIQPPRYQTSRYWGKVVKCACVKSRRSRSTRACTLFRTPDFVLATCSAEGELGYQQVRARMPAFFMYRYVNYCILDLVRYCWRPNKKPFTNGID